MSKYFKFSKNVYIYLISLFIRNISIGIFLVLFNLYILEIGISGGFLGLFLAIGNGTMAGGSLLFPYLTNKYSYKKILIGANLVAAFAFMLEIIFPDKYFLIVCSGIYGLGFAIIMSVRAPFIVKNSSEENRSSLFSLNSSVTLISTVIGTTLGGFLSKVNYLNVYCMTGLFIAGIIYFISTIPFFFMQETNNSNTNISLNSKNQFKKITREKSTVLIVILFLFLGGSYIFLPYINVYLNKIQQLNVEIIGIYLSVINLLSAVAVFIGPILLKKYKSTYVIKCGLVSLVILYGILLISNKLINIIILVCIQVIIEIILPIITKKIYEIVPTEKHNSLSGCVNFSYNSGDSLSNYLGGYLLSMSLWNYMVGLSAMSFMIAFVVFLSINNKQSSPF